MFGWGLMPCVNPYLDRFKSGGSWHFSASGWIVLKSADAVILLDLIFES